jgi:hypothetical protein
VFTLDVNYVEHPFFRVNVVDVGKMDLLCPGTDVGAQKNEAVRAGAFEVVLLDVL